MSMKTLVLSALISGSAAFPWVVNTPGVDSSLFSDSASKVRRQQTGSGPGGPATCPFNANHVNAAPITTKYPYNGAINGLPGKGVGGFLVPAKGDTAHQFVAAGKNDIRGPCPGLNAAANHNFLAHDGITTFNELVDAQQNVYNVGYDLAVVLAVLGLTTTDGDPITTKLSIGCDATTRTSVNPVLTGSEPGLDGHNKFEADTSLTRNDFFTHGGDNFSFNRTLFDMMTKTTKGNYDMNGLALYRKQRYTQSRAENENFYFGPFSLLLYGAASFLFQLMPSGTHGYAPDYATISSFFIKEAIPPNWTNRVKPYSVLDVGNDIFTMYGKYPVEFGGNLGKNNFNGLTFGPITNGIPSSTLSPKDVSCFIYQLATERIPSSLDAFIEPTVDAIGLASAKLGVAYKNLGCPVPLTR